MNPIRYYDNVFLTKIITFSRSYDIPRCDGKKITRSDNKHEKINGKFEEIDSVRGRVRRRLLPYALKSHPGGS